jgi:16S rRNA (cytidine1402-2'-O)-methyltransferase
MQITPETAPMGSLMVVATPIGNLEDITLRALRTLREADLVAAEDTRQTLRLMNHFEIRKPLVSCHDMNEHEKSDSLVRQMLGGKRLALVSDAGTPGISDPGEILIREAISAGIPVTMAPGPSAAIMAVVLSGFPTGRFCFEGFLPSARRDRLRHLETLVPETRTLVLYESPHRLRAVLSDLLEVLGDRRCALAREMTKIHEEVVRDSLANLISLYGEREPRGEYVIVLAGAEAAALREDERTDWLKLPVRDHVDIYLASGCDRMEAMKKAAKDRGLSKREIYAALQGDGRT